MPSPEYIAAHWAEMEQMPFDGVAITVPFIDLDGKRKAFEWSCWDKRAVPWQRLAKSAELLASAHFKNMRWNFIRFNSCPGEVDWFEDLSPVIHNARMVARLARLGRCRGILFDCEQYQAAVWDYKRQRHAKEYSFDAYATRVRHWGREFIRAVNEEYQDVTILFCFGYSLAHYETRGDPQKLPDVHYALWPAFLDGVLMDASPRTVLVDGHENSYVYHRREQFLEAYNLMASGVLPFVRLPRKYRCQFQAGFGIWMDPGGTQGKWSVEQPETNPRPPADLQTTLYHALDVADEYVWLYSQVPRFWPREKLPQAYIDAIRNARIEPGPQAAAASALPGPYHSAREHPAYKGLAVFKDLMGRYVAVGEPPPLWKFRTDPQDVGEKQGWFRPEYDDSGWGAMEVPEWWECKGVAYDGVAWYRVRWRVPKLPPHKRLILAFGAVDEKARVWVNGKFVGAHEQEKDNDWREPFHFDVTGALKPGQENVIVVRVVDKLLYGGIWRPVMLFAEM